MYICLCNRVTEKDIEEAASNGATSLRDLRSMLGVSSQCGTCESAAMEVLFGAFEADPGLYYQVA